MGFLAQQKQVSNELILRDLKYKYAHIWVYKFKWNYEWTYNDIDQKKSETDKQACSTYIGRKMR